MQKLLGAFSGMEHRGCKLFQYKTIDAQHSIATLVSQLCSTLWLTSGMYVEFTETKGL